MCHHWLLSWYQKHGGPAHYTLMQFIKVCRVVKAPWLVVWEILKSLCTDWLSLSIIWYSIMPKLFFRYVWASCSLSIPTSWHVEWVTDTIDFKAISRRAAHSNTLASSPPVSPLSSHFSPDFQVFLSCLTFTALDFFCTTAFSHCSHCFSLFNTPLFFLGDSVHSATPVS